MCFYQVYVFKMVDVKGNIFNLMVYYQFLYILNRIFEFEMFLMVSINDRYWNIFF